jgi:hypothetical protein
MHLARRLLAGGIAVLAWSVAPSRAASAEDVCEQWDLSVTCTTSAPKVTLGDEFSATATVKNTGNTALLNVTLTLRGDQGAPCVSGPGPSLKITIERLEPGDSKQVSGRFLPENVGLARILGNAHDSLGWATANCACSVQVEGLIALRSDMTDKDLGGAEKGVFTVGESFLYVLDLANEGGSGVTPDLKVVLTVPKELQFVSGKGPAGMSFTRNGVLVESTPFVLAPNQKLHVEYTVKAAAKPPVPFVKTRASIQTMSGVEIAGESESTTIQAK